LFAAHAAKMYAIVAVSYARTEQLPARMDVVNDNVVSYTTPILSTWVSTNGKTVLLPKDVPRLPYLPREEVWKWTFAKSGWSEYYITPARKADPPKMFYKNPCDLANFARSCKGVTKKKVSDSESDIKKQTVAGSSFEHCIGKSASSKMMIPQSVQAGLKSGKTPIQAISSLQFMMGATSSINQNPPPKEGGKKQVSP
jgi:hypothetical protein